MNSVAMIMRAAVEERGQKRLFAETHSADPKVVEVEEVEQIPKAAAGGRPK